MKRFLMLVAVATVAGAMYVAAAPGSQQAVGPTAKQFAALKKQVAGLSKKLKALKTDETKVKTLAAAEGQLLLACAKGAIPIDQFGDSANQTQGYRYAPAGKAGDPQLTDVLTTGLDVAATTDTGAGYFMIGDSSCSAQFSSGTLRHAAAKAGVRLPQASSHLPSFAAHRP
jgi:hypothetical protein